MIIRGVERANLCPAIGPMALLRYMLESNALGDASGRREPSASDLFWLSLTME